MINKTSDNLNFLIQSVDDSRNNVVNMKNLFKVLGFKDEDHKLPFILDSNRLLVSIYMKTANLSITCPGNISQEVNLHSLVAQINISQALVFYGCDLYFRHSRKLVVMDIETKKNQTTFIETHSQVNRKFQLEMCRCNEALDEYTRMCLSPLSGNSKASPKMVAVFLIFFLIISSLAMFALKFKWKRTNIIQVSSKL